MLPAQPNQSLMDGLACLQALSMHREPVGTRELARLLGMQPVRVNRLLKTLGHLGLAEQDERRRYRPGPAIHVLAAYSLHGSGLLRRVFKPLRSLRPLGLDVALGVLWRDRLCYVVHARAEADFDDSLAPPFVSPAAGSGLGLALLAQQSDDEIRELYAESDRDAFSGEPPVLDGEDGLLARLGRIRDRGYALAPIPGIGYRTLAVCLGAPAYAAIGVSGPFGDDAVDELLDALRETVKQIEAAES